MYLNKHKVPKRQAMTMEKMKVPLADAASPTNVLILMKTLLYLTMAIFMTRRLQEFLARVVRYYGLPPPGPV